jgi:hypothetical protein
LFDGTVAPKLLAQRRDQCRQQSAKEVREFSKQAHVTLLPPHLP